MACRKEREKEIQDCPTKKIEKPKLVRPKRKDCKIRILNIYNSRFGLWSFYLYFVSKSNDSSIG